MTEEKYSDLEIDDIDIFASTSGAARFRVDWTSARSGFGSCCILWHEDGTTTIDSEQMSAEFVKALLCKLVDKHFKIP